MEYTGTHATHFYDQSDQYYEKRKGLRICACMGAFAGEPYCPCTMAAKGLPMSKAHVKENQDAQVRWKEFFEHGGFDAN
jgi:hypothetical protein